MRRRRCPWMLLLQQRALLPSENTAQDAISQFTRALRPQLPPSSGHLYSMLSSDSAPVDLTLQTIDVLLAYYMRIWRKQISTKIWQHICHYYNSHAELDHLRVQI